MRNLRIYHKEITYEIKSNMTLMKFLQENGVLIESPCGGKGTCGKCKVRIISGKVNEVTEEEIKHLTKDEIQQGVRLSCVVNINSEDDSELVIELLNNKKLKHKILTEGYMPEFNIKPLITKKKYKLCKPTLEENISYEEILENTLGDVLIKKDTRFLSNLPKLFQKEEITAVYGQENKLIGIEVGNTSGKIYGVAVDIGTTTVVASLVDLVNGEELSSESEINPQKDYGLDVLSRIDFAKNNEEGLKLMHDAIIKCLNALIEELCSKNNISKDKIYEVTIGANATMMHILLGVDVNSIGKSPYVPAFTKKQEVSSVSLGINISPFGTVYCLPGVSSYIGADIVAGVVASELYKSDKNILFIDIGTNGEIVLSKGGQLSSCSCAAGPALEGMNISCGMRAADGAIEGIKIHENKIDLRIIGDIEPIGICGSGILESLSEIARLKLIGKTGRLKKKADIEKDEKLKNLAQYLIEDNNKRKLLVSEISKDKSLFITQDDIRQVQLAKGAILSGFYALLQLMEIDMMDLDTVIIAGQFGKHLSVESLTGVGIIPKELGDKVRYIGNSSKTGAVMCLLSSEIREEMEQVAKNIQYFELSTKEGYDRLFAKCLNFE